MANWPNWNNKSEVELLFMLNNMFGPTRFQIQFDLVSGVAGDTTLIAAPGVGKRIVLVEHFVVWSSNISATTALVVGNFKSISDAIIRPWAVCLRQPNDHSRMLTHLPENEALEIRSRAISASSTNHTIIGYIEAQEGV